MIRSLEDLVLVPGLTSGDVDNYEVPELGWSVPFYTEQGLTATVYIYPLPSLRDTEDRQSAVLAREFQAAKFEMFEYARQNDLEVVALDKSPGRVDPARLDATALHGSFLFRSNERRDSTIDDVRRKGSRFTEIILAMTGDQFIKLRCSYGPMEAKRDGRTINGLLGALRARIFS
jgi:hypothetical protein